MKSAVFERQQGQLATALETLATAIKKYPKFAKLYMIQGQIHQQQGDLAAARASFTAGIRACPKDVHLWVLASRLEEADGKSIKARALLDKARLANPANDVLWAEAVGVEERSGGAAQAKTVLARGTFPLPPPPCLLPPLTPSLSRRPPRMPSIGLSVVNGDLERGAADAQGALRGRAAQGRQRPVGALRGRAPVLDGAQDREGAALVRARGRRERAARGHVGRRVGVVAQV